MNSERTQSAESQHNKLCLGIDRLQRALDRGGNDATLHHDLGLLLSHSVIGRFEEAISHWKMAVRMDAMNPVYDAQIGYLHQYQIGDVVAAMRHYEASLRLKGNQSQIWNNLGILWAQSASDGQHIAEATECWRLYFFNNRNYLFHHGNDLFHHGNLLHNRRCSHDLRFFNNRGFNNRRFNNRRFNNDRRFFHYRHFHHRRFDYDDRLLDDRRRDCFRLFVFAEDLRKVRLEFHGRFLEDLVVVKIQSDAGDGNERSAQQQRRNS